MTAPVTGRTRSGLQDVWPLSPLQEGMYALARRDAGEGAYLVQQEIDLTADTGIDGDRLRRAATALLERYPNLRAVFRERKDGRLVQLIPARAQASLRTVDLSGLTGDALAAALDDLAADERAEPLDLARPPLLRWVLARTGPGRARLVMTGHHVLLDGWSTPLVVRDLLSLYGSGSARPSPTPAPSSS